MEINPQNESFQIKQKNLFKAAETGDSSILKFLSDEHLTKSLEMQNKDGRSLLHVAVSPSHLEVVKLLSTASDELVVNTTDEEVWPPVHSAARIGNLEILETMLRKGTLCIDGWIEG